MGMPNQFNDIIQKHLDVFAAWIPIVNHYDLGDYGVMSDGVFAKLGNIKDDYQITYDEGTGTAASIDFTSEGARVIKLSAGAEVDVIPAGEVDAKINIEFTKEKSFLVKSPKITVKTIENVNSVAKRLKAHDDWDGQWKVVHQVYNAQDAVVVSTIASGTKLSFSGEVTALQQLDLGNAGVNIDTNKTLGLKINGKDGIIGLGLFRVKSKLFGGFRVVILGEDDEDSDEADAIIVKPEDIIEDDI